MKALTFYRLCLQTYWANGDKCAGCVLAQKGVCERMTINQIAKTRYALMLKRDVQKKEKENAKREKAKEKENSLSAVWRSIDKKHTKNQKAKNYNSLLPEMQR